MPRQVRRTWSIALLALGLLTVAVPAQAGAARMAYVASALDNSITPINTSTNTAGAPFSSVGTLPEAIAITPNGRTATVANEASDNVVPFDLTTDPPTPGTPVSTGGNAFAIAIAPGGNTAYVANFDGTNEIVPVDIASNTAGTPIPVGNLPDAIAITPNGNTAYAANFADGTVTPINLMTSPPTPGAAITVEAEPQGIAITPNGTRAYVANCGDNSVSVINTATNTVTTTIPDPDGPNTIAITPDGNTAYTPDCTANDVTPIDTATNTTGTNIPAGMTPYAMAITPDGNTAYVTNDTDPGFVTPIGISTGSPTTGPSIPVGAFPEGIAITPNQPPTAAFTAGTATLGQATNFNGAGSSDPDGTVANYAWDFGDGGTASTSSATVNHTYAAAGNYTATLTVTDNEGCSTVFIFTGQTASCNGSSVARIQHQVTVAKASPMLTSSASADVALGGAVHDTATLATGQSPTGQITFRLFGPGDSSCSGTPVFTGTTAVSGNGAYQSSSFTPTQPGTYRWIASYSGDSNNNSAAGACGSAGESVTVTSKASPTLATNASADVALGGSVHDTATLAAGQSPTGQITFNLYGPGDSNCSGAPAFTDTAAVSGNGSYPSTDFTPTQVGTYRWTSSYSGDSNNNSAAAACGSAGESVTVTKVRPTLATSASRSVVVGGQVRDTVTLSGGHSPTGQLVVRLYRPGDDNCSGEPAFGDRIAVSGNGSYRSALFTPKQVGIFHWTASYSGDAGNTSASSSCGDRHESVWIQKATPSLTTEASIVKGDQIGDRATLGSGRTPTGQITFRLYGPGDNRCSSPIFTDKAPVNGNGAYRSARFTATRPGTYRFTARYPSDPKNRGAESPCNANGESVTLGGQRQWAGP